MSNVTEGHGHAGQQDNNHTYQIWEYLSYRMDMDI